jgi:hypothetical protein
MAQSPSAAYDDDFAALAEIPGWYHVRLTFDPAHGSAQAAVEGMGGSPLGSSKAVTIGGNLTRLGNLQLSVVGSTGAAVALDNLGIGPVGGPVVLFEDFGAP